MRWLAGAAAVLVAVAGATSGAVGVAHADAGDCAEDLSALFGTGGSRPISAGVVLTTWTAERPAAVEVTSRRVRGQVLHLLGGTAPLAPLVGGLPNRIDPRVLVAESGAVAAVNGDYFASTAVDAAIPRGPVLQGGIVRYAPPGAHRVVHWRDGRPHLHRARLTSWVTLGATRVPVAAINYPSRTAGTVMYRAPWQGRTVAGGTTVVLREGRVARIIRPGGPVAPTKGRTVLQVPEGTGLPPAVRIGDRAVETTRLANTRGARNAMGHGGRLLRAGALVTGCDGEGSLIRPRTALAWNRTGDAWLAVVSSGLPDTARGMRMGGSTTAAFGRWLVGLGATDAVLLDGGGSTIMLRDTAAGIRRIDLPQSAYRRPVPVLLGITPQASRTSGRTLTATWSGSGPTRLPIGYAPSVAIRTLCGSTPPSDTRCIAAQGPLGSIWPGQGPNDLG